MTDVHGGRENPSVGADSMVASAIERTRGVSVVLLAAVEVAAAGAHLIGRAGTEAGAAASMVLLVWAVFRLATARPTRWRPVADVAIAAAYALATPALVDGPEFTTAATPMLAVGGTTVVAMAIACDPARSLLVTIVIMGCWAVGAAQVSGVGNPLMIFNLDYLALEWVMAATVRGLVVRAARHTDVSRARLARTRTAADIAEARRRVEREAWAVIHDTALVTLTMLAHGVRPPARELHDQLRRDLRVLRRAGLLDENPTVELAAALIDLADKTQTRARYIGPRELEVPSVIGAAVIGAAGEALVNVDRHAAAHEVRIELGRDRLTITDDGVGFDPFNQTVAGTRHGIRNSIRGRLTDVGVAVEIDSATGAGTRIEIDWRSFDNPPPRPPEGEHSERLLDRYGYGLVFVAFVITATQCQFGLAAAHPTAQQLLLLVVIAITAVALQDVHTRVAAPLWSLTMASAVLVGAVQAALLEANDLVTAANWAVGALGWQVAALAYRRPIRAGMFVLGILWAGGALVVIGHGRDIDVAVAWTYSVISVASLQALAIWFGRLLRATVRDSEKAAAKVIEIRAAAALRAALHRDNLARVRRLPSDLAPLLTRLLDIDNPSADPVVRAECLVESVRLRRLFDPVGTCAHPLIGELTAAISAAESRGVAVTRLVLGDLPDLPPAQRSRILTAPIIVLEGARTRARVVVTGPIGPAQPPTLSVTADCLPDTLDAARTVAPDSTLVAAGELVWTSVPLA